jgi:hypothetical protein
MSSLYIILRKWRLYCENLAEVKEQFENILENDWFESDVLCFDPHFSILEENKLNYKTS